MSTGYVWDERFAWHDAGRASTSVWSEPYPALDRPESKRRLHGLLAASGLADKLIRIPARAATEAELARFHTQRYIRRVWTLSEAGGGEAGENARFGPHGYEVARFAAGGCIAAVDAVLSGEVDNAYALVRPCGHHAEPDRGRGFCIFGNVAIAVKHAQQVRGVERVAVVDWDVHHGNGTELAFYADPSVLTISLHQDRYYPVDSGGIDAVGEGPGRGFNMNLPLPPGSGHGAYLAAFDELVVPALNAFAPELIVVAAGYDAGIGDPLGRMLCYSETFRQMTRHLKAVARRHCKNRIVISHEGGYSPTYVPYCGLAVFEELAGIRTAVVDPLATWYSQVGGQHLQPHQHRYIRRGARVLDELTERISSKAREEEIV